MIILNPLGGSNKRIISANGVTDYDVNLAFCSRLFSRLREKGETVFLTRNTSEAKSDNELVSLIRSKTPQLVINVYCQEDLDPAKSGFTVECNKYSALVGTFAYVLKKFGLKPIYPTGYTINNTVGMGALGDISIGLGFLTNSGDARILAPDSGQLDKLVQMLVAYAYGAPVKAYQPDSGTIIDDPYFTDGVWVECEETKHHGDTGKIEVENYNGTQISILHLTRANRDHLVQPYCWATNVALDRDGEYDLFFTYRSASPNSEIIIRIGNDVKSFNLDRINWTTIRSTVVSSEYVPLFDLHNTASLLPANLSVKANTRYEDSIFCSINAIRVGYSKDIEASLDIEPNKLYLGIVSGDVLITGVWAAPKGKLGIVDDNARLYSVYPPDSRPIDSFDPTNLQLDLIQKPITSANTLIGRATDYKLPDVAGDIKALLGSLDTTKLNPQAFAESQRTLLIMLSQAASEYGVPFVDPARMVVDYSGLENILPKISRGDKGAAVQKAMNSIKSTQRAQMHMLKSVVERQQVLTRVGGDVSTKASAQLGDVSKVANLIKRHGSLDNLIDSNTGKVKQDAAREIGVLTNKVDDEFRQLSKINGLMNSLSGGPTTDMRSIANKVSERLEKIGTDMNMT